VAVDGFASLFGCREKGSSFPKPSKWSSRGGAGWREYERVTLCCRHRWYPFYVELAVISTELIVFENSYSG